MPGHVLARLDDPVSLDVAPALREAGHAPAGSRPGIGEGSQEARESVPLTSLARNATGVVAGVRIAHAAGESDPTLERTALRPSPRRSTLSARSDFDSPVDAS